MIKNGHLHKPTSRFNVLKIIGYALGGIVIAFVLGFLFGYFVMLLWNWLMPALFGLPTVTFWQAVGLVVLGKLIFGGGHHGHDHHSDHGKKFKDHFHKKDEDCCDYEEFWHEKGRKFFEEFAEKKRKETSLVEEKEDQSDPEGDEEEA